LGAPKTFQSSRQDLVLGLGKDGVLLEQRLRMRSGVFNQADVGQAGKLKLRIACLARPQELARTALLEVSLG
jgi:hypothetical protein